MYHVAAPQEDSWERTLDPTEALERAYSHFTRRTCLPAYLAPSMNKNGKPFSRGRTLDSPTTTPTPTAAAAQPTTTTTTTTTTTNNIMDDDDDDFIVHVASPGAIILPEQ